MPTTSAPTPTASSPAAVGRARRIDERPVGAPTARCRSCSRCSWSSASRRGSRCWASSPGTTGRSCCPGTPTCVEAGGFAGLADSFSNYNTPYLVAAGRPDLPAGRPAGRRSRRSRSSSTCCSPSFAYRIVREVRPGARWLPVIAFGATFLLPTVVLNSAWWAQCDSIYASLCLGSLYLLLRRQTALACVALRPGLRLQAAGPVLPARPGRAGAGEPAAAARPGPGAGHLPRGARPGLARRAGASPASCRSTPPRSRNPSGAGRRAAGDAARAGGGFGGGRSRRRRLRGRWTGRRRRLRRGRGWRRRRPRTASPATRPTWYAWLPGRRLDRLEVGRAWARRRRGAGLRGLARSPDVGGWRRRRCCSSRPRCRWSCRCCCPRCTSGTSSSARCSRWSRSSSTGGSSSWPR